MMKSTQSTRKARNTAPVPRQQTGALAQAAHNSPATQSLLALQRMADQSAVVQKAAALQRMEEDELQGKFIQRVEEDELQMKPIQRMEEDELQMKPIQRMEEGELQMKPIQRMEEDELQGKFIQRAEAPKTNNTGLPDNLKSGIESLSGVSMDHVKVHRDSDKPAAVQAHAYAQGSDIHLGPGQEKHLPHEAWHVVQQAQGRVKPTTQMKGVAINDDASLESEADVMGAKALTSAGVTQTKQMWTNTHSSSPLQLAKFKDLGASKTKKLYATEISKTGTAVMIDAVNDSWSNGSGVFLSDNLYDMEHWQNVGNNQDINEIVLPDKDAIAADSSRFLVGSFADNGLGVDANCHLVAEHELVHLKHANENLKAGLKTGPTTAVDEFSDAKIATTIGSLLDAVNTIRIDKLGMDIQRLGQAKTYIVARLNYILNVWNGPAKWNVEAPSVMRELNRYLSQVIVADDPEEWQTLMTSIKQLDQKCSESIGEKKSLWARIFG